MRYIISVKGNKEDIFKFALSDIDSQYVAAKGKHLYEIDHPKGTSFSVAVQVGNKKSKENRYATVKINEFKYPDKFAFDYRSSTYHKICEYSCDDSADKKEVRIHVYDERLSNGNVTKTGKDSEEYKKAPFSVSWQFRTGLRKFVRTLREEEKAE